MRSGYGEAIGFFEQALRIVGEPDNREALSRAVALRAGLGLALTSAKGPHSAEVLDFYARSLELCALLGDVPERIQLLFGLWNCHLYGSDLQRADQVASELLAAASDKDAYQRLEAHHSMWTTKINMGRPADAIEHLERAEELYRAATQSSWRTYAYHDPQACASGMGAVAYWSLGLFDRARGSALRGAQHASELGHSPTRMLAAMTASIVFYHCGDLPAARRHAENHLNIATEFGLSPWRERAAVMLARLLAEEGRINDALELLEPNFPTASAARWMMSGSMALVFAAEIYECAGEPERGFELLRSVQPEHLLGILGPELHRVYARTLLACSPGAIGEAQARLRTAIALAQERQMKALELRAALSLAQLLALRDRNVAREALAVVDWFTEGVDVADLRNARALRDELA